MLAACLALPTRARSRGQRCPTLNGEQHMNARSASFGSGASDAQDAGATMRSNSTFQRTTWRSAALPTNGVP
eukprot:7274829-Pyramimonas_sp.AAC.1